MERLLVLLKFELQHAWSGFKRRFLAFSSLFTYLATVITIIYFTIIFHGFLFMIPENTRLSMLQNMGLKDIDFYNSVWIFFSLLLLLSFIRGLVSHNTAVKPSLADIHVILPSPIAPSSLFVAKLVRLLVKRTIITIAVFFVLFPFLLYFDVSYLELVNFIFSCIFYSWFLTELECFTYFSSRSLRKLHRKVFVALIIPIFILTLTLIILKHEITKFFIKILPSTVLTEILYMCISAEPVYQKPLHLIFSIISLNLSVGIFLLLVTEYYFAHVEGFEDTIRSKWLPIFKGKLKWSLKRFKSPAIAIALKDFWTDIRGRNFPLLATSLIASITIALLGSRIIEITSFHGIFPIESRILIVILAMIISAVILSPSLNSFLYEIQKIWILKTAPISPREIVYGKFLYSLLTSLVFLSPVLVSLTFVLSGFEQLTAIVLIPFIIVVSSAEGVFDSVLFASKSLVQELPVTFFIFYFILMLVTIFPVSILVFILLQVFMFLYGKSLVGFQAISYVLLVMILLVGLLVLSYIFLNGSVKILSRKEEL